MDKLVDRILPAYPFVQYNDDDNVVAFFQAYNQLAREYLTAFTKLNLGFWAGEIINGPLLDWIALGIYGTQRHIIVNLQYPNKDDEIDFKSEGVYNTIEYDNVAYNEFKNKAVATTQYMSDDFFRRILLWNFFKEDGFQFSIPWLKKRMGRFFKAFRGDPFSSWDSKDIENGYDLTYYSVTVNKGVFTILIDPNAYRDSEGLHEDWFEFFKLCMETRLINLPFQYTFIVNKLTMTQPLEQ